MSRWYHCKRHSTGGTTRCDLCEMDVIRAAQGMQLREASRSEAEAEGLQPGPAKQDAPNPCYSPTPVSEEVRK